MSSTLIVPTIFTAIDRMSSPIANMANSTNSFKEKLNSMANIGAVAGTAVFAGLGLATKSAVDFEDRMADIAKTTGLQGSSLTDFGNELLNLSKTTRTSLDDLMTIGEIGGQLGVASDELIAFTSASNQFAIALGSDYASTDEAISQVGKLKALFSETKDMKIADVITKTGSVINQLGAVGAGTSANINDFMLRLGALPSALKPSITSAAALATVFEEVGLNSEISSGGFSNLMIVAGKNLPAFAKQMNVPLEQAKKLLQSDPTQFAVEFSKSLAGLKSEELSTRLGDLKLGSQETIKVVGALGSSYERLAFLQRVSSDAFREGNSLTIEAATKETTLAAKMKMTENNMKAFSIIIGTQLIPVLAKVIDQILPIITEFTNWAASSPNLAMSILGVAGALWSLKAILAIFKFAGKAYEATVWVMQAAQWAWNAAMSANPIGLIIIGIAALIALVVAIIAYWDEWGAALSIFLGPLGLVISLIQSFRRNWEMISESFSSGGIIEGIKAIGRVLIDAVLQPIEQLLNLLSKIPGMSSLAGGARDYISSVREGLNVNTDGNNREALQSPQVTQGEVFSNYMNSGNQNNNLFVDINDKGGNVNSVKSSGPMNIPVKVTSTQGVR